MAYDEVLKVLGPPDCLRFIRGRFHFYYNGGQVWFDAGRAVSSSGINDGTGYSSTFSEAIVVVEHLQDRMKSRGYVLGDDSESCRPGSDCELVIDGGMLRGLRNVTRATSLSGDICTVGDTESMPPGRRPPDPMDGATQSHLSGSNKKTAA